ncbi:MAG: SusD/RagB family nutrient-binding outer membrane lipoprotein [Bacteroidales bacterium]|nr:SusD/RagB family nutrient-binding outer membrane lipoprotein [Bacteroidales bacterium]
MKKLTFLLIILTGLIVSCTKNFEDYNTATKHAQEAPGQYLFANAQVALANVNSNTNVNINNWKLFAQYWTETTYVDEANYDIVNRNVGTILFRIYYRDILADFNEARRLVNAEVTIGAAGEKAKANKLFMIDLMEVYTYQQLVDIFGDVPYSEALNIENLSPVYDDAQTIYKDLLARAKAAADGLDASADGFGADDLLMGGDIAMWKKFANTLIVKLAITLSPVDAALAKTYIEGAYNNAFAFGESATFNYLSGANSNPLYQDLVQSGRHDFVAANTIVDLMNGLNDPRRASFFDGNMTDDAGNVIYIGGVYGASSTFSQYSHVAPRVEDPSYGYVMLDYTELAFYLAEAAERGFNVGGDAATWYENGIKSSMSYWNVLEAESDAYINSPDVAYATAPGDWEKKIGIQAYLAFYVRGLEGWTSYRRLDAPVLNIPPTPAEPADGMVPKRHTYPIAEQTLNGANYSAAASKIGGDRLSTKLFWDVK